MKLETIAKHLINTELSRQGLNKEGLARKLKEAGFEVTSSQNLRNKISYGSFSIIFFLQCMKALGVKQVSLEDLYRK
jgi:hypothetical protein